MLFHTLLICVMPLSVADASERRTTTQDGESEIESVSGMDWHPPSLWSPATIGPRDLITDSWAGITSTVSNQNDRDAFLTVRSYFSRLPDHVYGQRIWVPANATRRSWFPIRAPSHAELSKGTTHQNTQMELVTWAVDSSDDSKQVVRESTGQMQRNTLIPIRANRRRAGAFLDLDHSVTKNYYSSEALIALLVASSRPKQVYFFEPQAMPMSLLQLDAFDTLLLAGNDLADNSVAMNNVRDWVADGGTMWIMLDQVDKSTVDALLGDAASFEIVDHTSLTEFELRHDTGDESGLVQVESREFEEPVEWLRVLPGDARVDVWIEDFPALFWLELGRGKVMVTTVEARAWLDVPAPGSRFDPSGRDSDLWVVQSLRLMSTDFFPNSSNEELPTPSLVEYSSQVVGYQVISRWMIAALMGCYLVLMAVAGWLLIRRGRRRTLAWVCPSIAVLMAISLIGYGNASRQSIPTTRVDAQYVEIGRNADRFAVYGTSTLYTHDQSAVEIRGDAGTFLIPPEQRDHSVDVAWPGGQEWSYATRIGPGMAQFHYRQEEYTREPVVARAHFEGDQLIGTVHLDSIEEVDDVVLATARGLMAGDGIEGRQFRVSSRELLGQDEYFLDSVLSSEQQRRRKVYQQILSDSQLWHRLQEPRLYFWTHSWPVRVETIDVEREVGSALVSMPIDFERTPGGTQVILSNPWLPMRTRAKSGGFISLYDPVERQFVESNKPADAVLAYRIPWSVTPLTIERVSIEIRIQCTNRPLRIYVRTTDGEHLLLDSKRGDAGKLLFEVDGSAGVSLNEQSELLVGIEVGEMIDPEEAEDWQILDVKIELQGTTETDDGVER